MKFQKTYINGLYVIDLEPKEDERGYFSRVFCRQEFKDLGLDNKICQISRSWTKGKGTLRGLHFQRSPKAEAKIIQCLKGRVFDVVVDLRPPSPTFKRWFSIELSEDNKKMLYLPKGLAQGLLTLTGNCIMEYLITQFYSPQHADGVRWNDPAFKINWPAPVKVISERDKNWPLFQL